MGAIAEGLAVKALWAGFSRGMQTFLGRQIRITHPRPGETLTDPEPLGEGFCYPVRGTLKHLPANHEIWLLNQDERTGLVWPQGFSRVQYDSNLKTWIGRVSSIASPTGRKQVRIVAVVAPPTSHDFFQYFQVVGDKRQQYEPLKRIPAECWNTAYVQAYRP